MGQAGYYVVRKGGVEIRIDLDRLPHGITSAKGAAVAVEMFRLAWLRDPTVQPPDYVVSVELL